MIQLLWSIITERKTLERKIMACNCSNRNFTECKIMEPDICGKFLSDHNLKQSKTTECNLNKCFNKNILITSTS